MATSWHMNMATIAKMNLKASVIEGQAPVRGNPPQVQDWGQVTSLAVRIKLIFNAIGAGVRKYILDVYVDSVGEQQADCRIVNAAALG
jgi:hypothetical protein